LDFIDRQHPRVGEHVERNLAAILAKRLILANARIATYNESELSGLYTYAAQRAFKLPLLAFRGDRWVISLAQHDD
jgi:hypothetical protein